MNELPGALHGCPPGGLRFGGGAGSCGVAPPVAPTDQDVHAPSEIPFVRDDGGRRAAGFTGEAGDCACRAISIATRRPYGKVHADLAALTGSSRRVEIGDVVAAVPSYLASIGWQFTLNRRRDGRYTRMGDLGRGGCVLEFRSRRLTPSADGLVGGHFAALVDGELHDLDDHCCTRPVWGWWRFVAILAHGPKGAT